MLTTVADLRRRLGLTQAEFAERVGVNRVTISRWENGRVRPTPLALRALSCQSVPAHSQQPSDGMAGLIADSRSPARFATRAAVAPDNRRRREPSGLTGEDDATMSPRMDSGAEIEAFRRSPILADLDREQLAGLAGLTAERRFKAGEFLFVAGNPVECCYLLVSGMVKIFKHSPSGTACITGIFGPGEMLGSLLLFGIASHPSSGQAVTGTRVLMLRNDSFISFLTGYPGLGPRVLRRILDFAGKRHESAVVRLSELAVERADYRLARVLFGLCLEFGSTIPLTRREIAEMAGTTTETAARFVSLLRQKGVVESLRGKVRVIKWERLRVLAEV
ncbi:MAG: helix-turn-helix domain-containing protein [Chloroflexi bacterium]|nr:helix-turn-helix domain-containing protein [Chloroflexota bacterium]